MMDASEFGSSKAGGGGPSFISGGKSAEDLLAKVSRWRSILDSGKCGPLLIAHEVVEVANSWKSKEDFSSFLTKNLGKSHPLKKFYQWAHAVDYLGKEVKRTMEARAAIWLAGACPPEKVGSVMDRCYKHKRTKNHGNVISLEMVRRIARPILGKIRPSRVKACERCAMLEGILRQHGIEVPPTIH